MQKLPLEQKNSPAALCRGGATPPEAPPAGRPVYFAGRSNGFDWDNTGAAPKTRRAPVRGARGPRTASPPSGELRKWNIRRLAGRSPGAHAAARAGPGAGGCEVEAPAASAARRVPGRSEAREGEGPEGADRGPGARTPTAAPPAPLQGILGLCKWKEDRRRGERRSWYPRTESNPAWEAMWLAKGPVFGCSRRAQRKRGGDSATWACMVHPSRRRQARARR